MITEIVLKLKKAKVTVIPSPDAEPHVTASAPIVQETVDGTFTVESDQSKTIELEVQVPASVTSLDANLGWGPMTIQHLVTKAIDVNVGLGNLVIETSTGGFDVNVGKGNITMKDLTGWFDLNAGMGSVNLHQIRGDADINDGLGNIAIEESQGTFEVSAGKGDIRCQGLNGHLEANSGMGAILVRDSKKLSLEANSGFGKIEVLGGTLLDVDCEAGIGSVTVEAALSALTVEVKNRGDIHVAIPVNQGARVEAITDQGRIVSQMDLVEVNNPGPSRGQRLVGTVGDGATPVSLHTRRGTVTLGHFDATVDAPNPTEFDDVDPRLEILTQLQEGTLTVDEADALLTQLDNEP